MKEANERL